MPRKAVYKNDIPFHKLQQTNALGFQIEWIDDNLRPISEDEFVLQPHRDDHYLFLVMERGSADFMVDFNFLEMRGRNMVVILPAQVHHFIRSCNALGWFLAIDTSLVGNTFTPVFEDRLYELKSSLFNYPQNITQCLQLLHNIYTQNPPSPYQRHTLYALLTSFVAMAAAVVTGAEEPVKGQVTRPVSITRAFRKMVSEKFVTTKNPGDYAALLNLSPSYLNEAVKNTTGASVSYWIQHETMLEARRLLYHSDLTVKEIAYRTGYEDPAYFQRMFRKVLQCTPIEFRNRYRELSNINR